MATNVRMESLHRLTAAAAVVHNRKVETLALEVVSDCTSSRYRNIQADAADAHAEKEDEAVPLAGCPAGALSLHLGHRALLALMTVHRHGH